MQYYIVALATLFALFWDEALITLFTMWYGKNISRTFMITWVILSGLLTSLLVALHMPTEYRVVTMVVVSAGVIFSINGYNKRADADKGHGPKA